MNLYVNYRRSLAIIQVYTRFGCLLTVSFQKPTETAKVQDLWIYDEYNSLNFSYNFTLVGTYLFTLNDFALYLVEFDSPTLHLMFL